MPSSYTPGGTVDLSSPGPIGNVTPSTGAFTTLIASSTTGHIFGNGSTGSVQIGDAAISKAPGNGFQFSSGISINQAAGLALDASAPLRWPNLALWQVAPGTLALRNGTDPQEFQVYNTYTDDTNFERGVMDWNGNVLEIGTEAGIGGTVRLIRLIGVAESDPGVPGTLYWDSNTLKRSA